MRSVTAPARLSEPPLTPPSRWPDYRGDFGGAFLWLLLGALVYAAALPFAVRADPQLAITPVLGPSVQLTPLFGLPFVLARLKRNGRLRRLVYFLLLVPLAHAAASYVAWAWAVEHFRPFPDGREFARNLFAGAVGGVTGATLSFAVLPFLALVPRRRASVWKAAFATLLLGTVGAYGMAWGLRWTNALRTMAPNDLVLWLECVHLPWQVGFAASLAWLMPIPPKLFRIEVAQPR